MEVDVFFKDNPDKELSDIGRCLNVESLNVLKFVMPYQTVAIVNEDFNTTIIVCKEMCCTFFGTEARCTIKEITLCDLLSTYGRLAFHIRHKSLYHSFVSQNQHLL